jgi:hypothetical protein
LPWTAAEFEQLKGRIYRQGQSQSTVTMILPLTYAEVHGQRWSWCQSKMQRLRFKKSIADAAVDGVVPEGHLRTPAQAYQDVMAWLMRLDAGEVEVIIPSGCRWCRGRWHVSRHLILSSRRRRAPGAGAAGSRGPSTRPRQRVPTRLPRGIRVTALTIAFEDSDLGLFR